MQHLPAFSLEAVGHATVVRIRGELDMELAPQLRDCLADLDDLGHYQIVVDLVDAESLDSTALGVFIGARKRLRKHGGSLVLVAPPAPVENLFHLIGMADVFPVFGTVAEAVDSVA